MSHYSTTPELQVKGLKELAAALRHLGFVVEVHAEAQTLMDWHGRPRPQRAHVIVRRLHTGRPSSNDLGWERMPDGSIQSHISDYDKGVGFGDAWRRALVKECGVQRATLRALRLGHRVTRTVDRRGRPRLEIAGRW